MKKRTAITPAELYVLLEREFRRRKASSCAHCYIQLPYRVDAKGEEAANWEVVLPPPCGRGCSDVIEKLVAEYQDLYELTPFASSGSP